MDLWITWSLRREMHSDAGEYLKRKMKKKKNSGIFGRTERERTTSGRWDSRGLDFEPTANYKYILVASINKLFFSFVSLPLALGYLWTMGEEKSGLRNPAPDHYQFIINSYYTFFFRFFFNSNFELIKILTRQQDYNEKYKNKHHSKSNKRKRKTGRQKDKNDR